MFDIPKPISNCKAIFNLLVIITGNMAIDEISESHQTLNLIEIVINSYTKRLVANLLETDTVDPNSR